MTDQSKKDKAQAEFKKTQRAEDGKKAMAEYESEGAAMRAKTARLKALRLARDAALPAPPPKIVGKKKPAKKGTSAKLSDWLDEQQKGGRNS